LRTDSGIDHRVIFCDCLDVKGKTMNTKLTGSNPSALANPWVQLIIGVICMACVANLQYGWTLFVNPIDAKYHWGRSAIQIAFTIFVLIETWLIPVEGYLVDKFGPRWVVLGGGILVAIAWVMNSMADSLSLLYVGAALGGVGTGCVYGTCVGAASPPASPPRGSAQAPHSRSARSPR
jgi:OFA family oxalate/formate antiporter-like MFS transporter